MAYINSANLSDSIVEHITEKIIRMEFLPGDKINESALAKELRVSHSPVREALRVLEKNRLVTLVPRKGAYVTEIVKEEVETIFDVMAELIVIVGKRLIHRAIRADINSLMFLAENVCEAARQNNVLYYHKNVIRFGLTSLELCNDKVLEDIIYSILPGIRRMLYLAFVNNKKNLSENSKLMMSGARALDEGDPKKVEAVIRKWLKDEKEKFVKTLQEGNYFKKKSD